MKNIRVIKREDYNWYEVGEQFLVRDENIYSFIGIQVWADGPDVVQHGHYEFID
ncbi:hypothetical protein [Paenibacillus donghaensis]|uniref:hypothetical protein n=1 Tax=Paenibacillus donghaensis TaxID=414771 RepID=UPI0012FE76D3|nr:hypothetical protein [Paenibacillus donghaensis]